MISSVKANRTEERIACARPVHLGNTKGITRDISASGMYLETGASYIPGSRINFTVEFDSPGGKLMLRCTGETVRIEPRDDEIGVAVKIINSVMVPGSQAGARA